jgi:hypothetical protein
LFDRAPLDRWSVGRVTLLEDGVTLTSFESVAWIYQHDAATIDAGSSRDPSADRRGHADLA